MSGVVDNVVKNLGKVKQTKLSKYTDELEALVGQAKRR